MYSHVLWVRTIVQGRRVMGLISTPSVRGTDRLDSVPGSDWAWNAQIRLDYKSDDRYRPASVRCVRRRRAKGGGHIQTSPTIPVVQVMARTRPKISKSRAKAHTWRRCRGSNWGPRTSPTITSGWIGMYRSSSSGRSLATKTRNSASSAQSECLVNSAWSALSSTDCRGPLRRRFRASKNPRDCPNSPGVYVTESQPQGHRRPTAVSTASIRRSWSRTRHTPRVRVRHIGPTSGDGHTRGGLQVGEEQPSPRYQRRHRIGRGPYPCNTSQS